MKRVFSILAVTGLLTFGALNNVSAQDQQENVEAVENKAEQATDSTAVAAEATKEVAKEEIAPVQEDEMEAEQTFHQIIKQKFIEGGAGFMGIVLLTLILGLAIAIERIIYLNLSTTNTTKLLKNVEDALASGGVEEAKELCRNTRGPVASIFYQGLDRNEEGIDMIEKSIVAYGGVQMGQLEKNLSWLSLFIALAPMLGFMGTVIGMIAAFDSIEAAGNISPTLVAKGIKQALITTVFGLIVAMILQVFYNYIVSKVDSIVNKMEDASITLIDMLVKHKK
ncbi:MAG: MotA/TolQ/ExbB proton channel family protein [Ichthyobacteriaceae bacterium]|nr:MotA/TolQ/ExbB proton channel family protein [Ichthyobacteriaceae bacterium]